MKILIVEDELELLSSMKNYLSLEGFVCEIAPDYETASQLISTYQYDCIVIDITLPDKSGLLLIDEIKMINTETGIIIVSAKNSIDDRVLGLAKGSDDYLTKPFPKSLDNTWAQIHQVKDALEWEASLEDKMYTAVEFIAMEIARALVDLDQKGRSTPLTLFCTGGGALNHYLISRIRFHCEGIEIILPSRKIIEFKEVSFIALAGLFRCLRIPNLFASVTGAPADTINGALYSNSTSSSWS